MGNAVSSFLADGDERGLMLMTLTISHQLGDRLGDLLDILDAGWRTVQRRGTAKRDAAKCGIVGWLRGLEITYGSNGAHPHLHLCAHLDRKASSVERAKLENTLWRAFRDGVREAGGRELLRKRAQDFKWSWGTEARADFEKYATKMEAMSTHRAVAEMTRQDCKQGKKSSRGPLQILGDAVAGWVRYKDEADPREAARLRRKALADVGIWRELSETMHRRCWIHEPRSKFLRPYYAAAREEQKAKQADWEAEMAKGGWIELGRLSCGEWASALALDLLPDLADALSGAQSIDEARAVVAELLASLMDAANAPPNVEAHQYELISHEYVSMEHASVLSA